MLTQRCMAFIGAIVGIVLTIVPAPAATYNYIGKPDASSGNYLTAVVELNCISCGAGTYDPYGPNPGISSFSLSAYSSSDVLLARVSNTDPLGFGPAFEFNSFLTLDGAGHVTNWSLFRTSQTAGSTATIIMLGFARPGLSEIDAPLVNQEVAYLGGTFLMQWIASAGSSNPAVGVWTHVPLSHASASEVPLPAALPLFATVFGGAGLLAWRRKRKAAAKV